MLATAAAIVQLLIGSSVGMRLLWLAVRGNGGSPAWSCGLGFLFLAVFGGPVMVASGVGATPSGDVNHGLFAFGIVSLGAGISAFLSFTLMTFRRGAAWAWGVVVLGIVGLAFATFGQIGSLASAPRDLPSAQAIAAWGTLLGVLVTFTFGWLGVEGMIEWRNSKRRVSLGLGDPVMSSRLFCWGLFGLSTSSFCVLSVAMSVLSPESNHGAPGQVLNAVIGLIGSASVLVAFFPSDKRQERLRADSARG